MCGFLGQNPNTGLLAIAGAVSALIAEGRTADELGQIAALIQIVADNLALLALSTPDASSDGSTAGSSGSGSKCGSPGGGSKSAGSSSKSNSKASSGTDE